MTLSRGAFRNGIHLATRVYRAHVRLFIYATARRSAILPRRHRGVSKSSGVY